MKIGEVRVINDGLFPAVEIEVRRTHSGTQPRPVEALLDTGFDGALSLPSDYVETLQLPLMTERVVTLGDGSSVNVKVHVGFVRIASQWYRCAVLATGDIPTVGMHLMQGLKVCFEATEDGEIEIVPLNA